MFQCCALWVRVCSSRRITHLRCEHKLLLIYRKVFFKCELETTAAAFAWKMTVTMCFIWGAFQDTQGRRAKRKYFKTVRGIKQQRIDRAKTGILKQVGGGGGKFKGSRSSAAERPRTPGVEAWDGDWQETSPTQGAGGTQRGGSKEGEQEQFVVSAVSNREETELGEDEGGGIWPFGARERPCCWVVKEFEVFWVWDMRVPGMSGDVAQMEDEWTMQLLPLAIVRS